MKVRLFIVMGVSGCGKTCVGEALADQIGWDYYDAGDFHPPENVAKMESGIPLNDSDRAPWLAALHDVISSSLKQKRPGVLACSTLKERYGQQLLESNDGVQIVYLKGSYDLISSCMSARKERYMKPDMLKSQFDTLEEPTNALTIDISLPVADIVKKIIQLSRL